MTTKLNMKFKRGETLRLDFALHDTSGDVLPISAGETLEFRMARGSTLFLKLTKNDMQNIDGSAGTGSVLISDSMFDAANVPASGVFNWELFYSSPTRGDSIQGEGTLTLEASLKERLPGV
jgi:hypothetical protein